MLLGFTHTGNNQLLCILAHIVARSLVVNHLELKDTTVIVGVATFHKGVVFLPRNRVERDGISIAGGAWDVKAWILVRDASISASG